jgi:hypothetical protein
MKKLIAIFATVLLGAVGLVGWSGGTAQAGHNCPYTGCLKTNTDIDGPRSIARHHRAKMRVEVTSGNAKPRGKIKFITKRNKGGFRHVKFVPYRGEPRIIRTPRLHKKGWYTVTAIYKHGPNQPFYNSRESTQLRVRRR